MIRWAIHDDGSFDLHGGPIQISRSYPAIDGLPLRATRVTVSCDPDAVTITYAMAIGAMTLRLIVSDGCGMITSNLTDVADAPYSVDLLASGQLLGVSNIYKQAHGIGGGSGPCEMPGDQPLESFGITGLIDICGRVLTIHTDDVSRFEQRTSIRKGVVASDGVVVTVGFKTERIPLPDGRLTLPTITFRLCDDVTAGMRQAATSIAGAMHSRPSRPASYHWCSWYYAYQNFDMTLLRETLEGFTTAGPERSVDYVQIDAGYSPAVGDWLLPNHRFPDTLKAAFELISAAGHRPGIWIGPFMVGNRSRLALDHPDWLLRDTEGKLVTPWRQYGEQRVWGYRDEEAYVLDTSHPGAFGYLRHVFRTMRDWGATMFKTDFMYWGLQDSNRVLRHTPGKTSIEYFRDVLHMIRQEIGAETLWLGCIAPYLPFVGYADAMRIAGDVGSSWANSPGTQNMLRETVGSQHFNNVFWQNDPDVLLVRDFHTELTDDEVIALALWQSIMGGVVATSDPLHELSPARQALWDFVRPPVNAGTADLPLLLAKGRPLVARRKTSSGDDVIVVFNPRADHCIDRLKLSELGIDGNRFAYRRTPTTNERIGACSEIVIDLRPHAAVAFHLASQNVEPEGPLVS